MWFWHGFGGELADFGGPVGRPHRGVEVGVSHVHAEERTEQANHHSTEIFGQACAGALHDALWRGRTLPSSTPTGARDFCFLV
jgi:hypothetical protein